MAEHASTMRFFLSAGLAASIACGSSSSSVPSDAGGADSGARADAAPTAPGIVTDGAHAEVGADLRVEGTVSGRYARVVISAHEWTGVFGASFRVRVVGGTASLATDEATLRNAFAGEIDDAFAFAATRSNGDIDIGLALTDPETHSVTLHDSALLTLDVIATGAEPARVSIERLLVRRPDATVLPVAPRGARIVFGGE